MERYIDLKEVSDGKLYEINDMVKAGCGDCKGCSDCCQDMGESILVDPYDIYRLTTNLECSFDELLETCLELHVVDGVTLPNMRMVGTQPRCPFLNAEGRCNIHKIRPGICRLFPLGRCYEDGSFKYFLQVNECKKEPKTKVKIKNWMDTPEIKKYEQFIVDWHYFLKDVQKILEQMPQERLVQRIHIYLLEKFFRVPYKKDGDFYEQFYQRLVLARRYVGIAG